MRILTLTEASPMRPFFMRLAAPVVLSTIGWLWLLDSLYSVVNWTLAKLHLDSGLVWLLSAVNIEEDAQVPLQWLGRPNLALIAITLGITYWAAPGNPPAPAPGPEINLRTPPPGGSRRHIEPHRARKRDDH